MAGTVNKVILIGHLGQNPDIRAFQDGGRVANMSVATSESWKDKATGERKERTQWHRVVVLNEKLVEVCEKYIKKGHKVYIEGQLETRKYTDKGGAEKSVTEIVLRPFRGEINMLESRGSDNPSNYVDENTYAGDGAYTPAPSQGAAPAMPDDEIPF